MPVSGTRRLMTGGGWNTPSFDIYDSSLALYAPLWRGDMIPRGGSIINGTGTMDVSPQALAVGANTITVTVAGTLLVNMPEGGTVASGTMTVTGSPVTVSAGIATTITTTGAIGNITCTPSNIIRTKDKSKTSFTVVGGVWGKYGWTADGDDYLNAAQFLNFGTGGFSISAWVKATASATQKRIIGNDNAVTPYYYLAINATTGTGVGYWRDAEGQAVGCTGTTDLTGAWHFITFVRKTSDPTTGVLFVDGVQEATQTTANADGSITATGASPKDGIGYDYNGAGADRFFFVGTIGEVKVHKARSLTIGEHIGLMQRTQWRYK